MEPVHASSSAALPGSGNSILQARSRLPSSAVSGSRAGQTPATVAPAATAATAGLIDGHGGDKQQGAAIEASVAKESGPGNQSSSEQSRVGQAAGAGQKPEQAGTKLDLAGKRPETVGKSAAAPPVSTQATATTVIAAGAPANAAAASASAEASALGSLPHAHPSQGFGVMPASSPPKQLPAAPAASTTASAKMTKTGAGVAPASTSDAGRAGQLGTGPPASHAASASLLVAPLQQQPSGSAMAAISESGPGANTIIASDAAPASTQAPALATAVCSAPGSQHHTSNPSMPMSYASSWFASQPYVNPTYSLPSGPSQFRPPSNPTLGPGAAIPPTTEPFSSAAANPSRTAGPPPGTNGSTPPVPSGLQASGIGLASSLPKPSSHNPTGSQTYSPAPRPSQPPQGLHATAPLQGPSTNMGPPTSQVSSQLLHKAASYMSAFVM